MHTGGIRLEYGSATAAISSRYRITVVLFVCLLAAYTVLSFSEGVLHPKALVLASYSYQDTSWTNRLSRDWKVYRYIADDRNAEYAPSHARGREALTYLSWIIEHYDRLPETIVFHHGDLRAWHQPADSPWMLAALDWKQVQLRGYVNLRCMNSPGCDDEAWTRNTLDNYDADLIWRRKIVNVILSRMYKPDDAWYAQKPLPAPAELQSLFPEVPISFDSPCCSQFAVSRATILEKPLEFWQRLLEPLEQPLVAVQDILHESEDILPEWAGHLDKKYHWVIGNIYEPLWHIFFGKDVNGCIDEEVCNRLVFRNRIRCLPSRPTWWDPSFDENNVTCAYSADGTWPDGSWGNTLQPGDLYSGWW